MTSGAAKSPQRLDVERIVRQVLAELEVASDLGPRTSVSPGELVLTTKVISLAEVEDRLSGVSRVVVPRGAVFTPAARDELRKHKVAVASDATSGLATKTGRLAVCVVEIDYEPTAIFNMLSGEGVQIERLPNTDLIGAIDAIGEAIVSRGGKGLLITGRPAAAMCLANRMPGVRAALGHSVSAVVEAMRSVAANLLVIDPGEKSTFEIRQMTRDMLRAPNHCPGALRDRLA